MEGQNLRTAPRPPYSPDLAPSDFFLFGHVKRVLPGAELQSSNELLDAVVQIVTDIPPEIVITTFHQWLDRLQASVDSGGEDVEGAPFYNQKPSLISTGNRDAEEELNTLYKNTFLEIGVLHPY
jgi:hypothetical protein